MESKTGEIAIKRLGVGTGLCTLFIWKVIWVALSSSKKGEDGEKIIFEMKWTSWD